MELLQTTLCYLEKDGAYLMLHRVKKKNDVNHDKWVGVPDDPLPVYHSAKLTPSSTAFTSTSPS